LEAPDVTKKLYAMMIELHRWPLLYRVLKNPRVTRSMRDCKGNQIFLWWINISRTPIPNLKVSRSLKHLGEGYRSLILGINGGENVEFVHLPNGEDGHI
jgi:hypothetical protein